MSLTRKDQKKLDEIVAALRMAHSAYSEFVADQRADYDERSEKWQESEVGEGRLSVIEDLENVDDDIENALAAIESHGS